MSDTKVFNLPDLGEGLTEGEVVSWLVAVGDTVVIDQPVAEIETAKAVVEVPCPFAGVIAELHGEVGGEVEVGAPFVTVTTGAAPGAGSVPESGDADDVAEGGETPGAVPEGAPAESLVPPAEDEVEDDPDDGGSGNVLVGYGTGGGGGRRRRRGGATKPAGRSEPAGSAPGTPERPLAKPPVRKLAKDLGVDLAALQGTGPEGRILREDVHAHANGQDGDATAAAAQSGAAADEPDDQGAPRAAGAPAEDDVVERIPMKGVRKMIAANMTRSRSEIPDATTWVDVDATELWATRERLNRREDVRLTPLALVLRAIVAGIRAYPRVNGRLSEDGSEIVVGRAVHLGVAAQTDAGLVVPVVRHAERRSLVDLATELRRLVVAVRERRATPDELRGSTLTVSNYGSFGVDGGSPIINPGEAAIVGVGRILDRPWVVDGALEVRKVMQLSIAFDHRICDGGEAAGFLRFVADCIEDPDTLLAFG